MGTGRRAQRFVRYLSHNRELGLKVMGFVDEDQARVGMSIHGYTVLGNLNQLPEILRDHIIDYVVFIVPRSSLNKIEPSLA